MSLQNNTSELNIIIPQIAYMKEEYGTQSGLISQIKTVLQQKASGEVPPSKLASFIDGSLTEIKASDLEGATSVRERAFYYSPITSVVIPNSVKQIGMYAFGYCTAQVVWEENSTIETLGGYSFSNYKGTTIEIPNSVTAINDYAFDGCACIEILLPNSIKRLGGGVFQNCANLTNIEIPSSVTNISVYALQIGSYANKATIRFLGTTPPTITTSTFDKNKLEKIIVPKGYGDTYKSKTNWANFADYIVESET